ncbi:hypothetical protein AA15237_1426 [Komagataeibacter xylinus NBRC 15237]|nr:hypothetical protein AA15237_1426 [Komagataeibacter xylinus NBRC 15237]
MGERLVRNEEVRGSIPLSSTTIPLITMEIVAPGSGFRVVCAGCGEQFDPDQLARLFKRLDQAQRGGGCGQTGR